MPSPTHWRRRVSRGLALAPILPLLLLAGPASAQERVHQVQAGETLTRIAWRYRTSTPQLRQWNSLENDRILVGQRLVVGHAPPAPAPAEAPSAEEPAAEQEPEDGEQETPEARCETGGDEAPPATYRVAEADTLGCIALRFGVAVEDLVRWNEGIDPDRIRVGHELSVRPLEPAPAPPQRLAGHEHWHVVTEGETLSAIALAHGVTVGQIVEWNEGLDPDRIAPGRRLLVIGPFELDHVVRRGESVASVARRYGVSPRDVLRWNRGVRVEQLPVGARLTIQRERPPSESVGSAACGRLVDGLQLPPHPGYVLRNPERSYATEETVSHILAAFDAVVVAHPDAPRTRVHDLSLPEGGPMDDHRSHQSGRDVDIIYYQRSCPNGVCPYREVRPRELDPGPTWTLLEHWLRAGVAELIFVDHGLQPVLYAEARRRGATDDELARWFQHPRERGVPVGIIRHIRNHADHVHVRFVCPESDESCR